MIDDTSGCGSLVHVPPFTISGNDNPQPPQFSVSVVAIKHFSHGDLRLVGYPNVFGRPAFVVVLQRCNLARRIGETDPEGAMEAGTELI